MPVGTTVVLVVSVRVGELKVVDDKGKSGIPCRRSNGSSMLVIEEPANPEGVYTEGCILWELIDTGSAPGMLTGQKDHSSLSPSQYKSIENRRNPIASRLEKQRA
jgi:hypothetical protein